MSNFIDELEQELRAAEQRRLRLAAARAPRPPRSAVLFTTSLAVVIAVIAVVLVAHSPGSGTAPPARPATAPAVAGRTSTATASTTTTPQAIVQQCLALGTVSGSDSLSELRGALREMPRADLDDSRCPRLLVAAMVSAVRSVTRRAARESGGESASVHNMVLSRCLARGSLSGRYSVGRLRRALVLMTAGELRYSRCGSVIVGKLARPLVRLHQTGSSG